LVNIDQETNHSSLGTCLNDDKPELIEQMLWILSEDEELTDLWLFEHMPDILKMALTF